VREPFLARWKGRIAPGQVSQDVGSTMDLFPTVARLTGGLPKDVTLDGTDLAPVLWEGKGRPQPDLFYYHSGRLRAMRRGPWKLHLSGAEDKPELYQIEQDISERFNVAAEHSATVTEMMEAMRRHQASFEPAPTQR
jgi:arylsulfatase